MAPKQSMKTMKKKAAAVKKAMKKQENNKKILGGLLMLTDTTMKKTTRKNNTGGAKMLAICDTGVSASTSKFPEYERGLSTTERNLRRVYQNQWNYCRHLIGEGRFHVYFGAFGTGILGIRKGKEADFDKDHMEYVPAGEEPIKTDVLDKKTGKYRRAKLGSSFIILFLAHSKYNDSYDASTETLNWMSQRSDCQNRKIGFIEQECEARRAIVVIVDKGQDYRTIGVATKFAIKSKAKMNCKEGTMCYFDSKVYHSDKNCEKLRRDSKTDKPIVNLRSLKHSHIEDARSAKRGAPCCSNCMWTPPKAKITFETTPTQETVSSLVEAGSNEHDVFRRGVTRKGKSPYHNEEWVELDRETRRSQSAARKDARLAKKTNKKMTDLVSKHKSMKQYRQAVMDFAYAKKKQGAKKMSARNTNQSACTALVPVAAQPLDSEWVDDHANSQALVNLKPEIVVKTKMIRPKDISELPAHLQKKFDALHKKVEELKMISKKSKTGAIIPAALKKKFERLNDKVAEFRKPQDVSELPAHLKKKFERMIAKVAEYKKPGSVEELPAALKKKFEKLSEKVAEFKKPESVSELPSHLKYKYASLQRQLQEKQEENRELMECLPKALKELRDKGEVEEPIFVRGYYRTAHGVAKQAKKNNKKVKKMDPKKAQKVIKAKELARKKLADLKIAKAKKMEAKKNAKLANKKKLLAIKN